MKFMLFGHVHESYDGQITVRIYNIVSNHVFKITRGLQGGQVVKKYSWKLFRYVHANASEASEVRHGLIDHYFRKVKKSGIKDLKELHAKKILLETNPFYEEVVKSLKRADYLPCTEEEKPEFHPIPEEVIHKLMAVKYLETFPADIIKEELYNAFSEQCTNSLKPYIKTYMEENPGVESYPEVQKINQGDLGGDPKKFAMYIINYET